MGTDTPATPGDDAGSPDVSGDAPEDFSGLEGPSTEDLGRERFDSSSEPTRAATPPTSQPAAPAAAAPATPATPPAAAPPQAAPAQASPAAPGTPSATGQGEQPGGEPELDSYNPADLITALDAGAAEFVAHMAQQHFQLTPEDLAELESNPETFLPKAAGRIAFIAAKQTLAHINRLVPKMIENTMRTTQERTTKRDEAKSLFRSQWPQIPDTEEANSLIGQFAKIYRQSNPNAPLADVVANVGRGVAAYLGLGSSGAPATGRPTGTPQPPARPAAFSPAPAGVEVKAPVENDPWSGMFRDYE